jgi:AAA15 family ATPase/GTPase
MLIEFSVTNFRSFRERQTFSMAAAPRLKRKNCVFDVDVEGEKLPGLLKLAALYGPNASGKSNFLKALTVIRNLTRVTPTTESADLDISPFRFDSHLLNEPSVFEMHFVTERCRYQFEVAATSSRIHSEKLISYPHGRESVLYERSYDGVAESYKIGPALEGGSQLHDAWRKLTSPQLLFLSQAVANSSEELNQLRSPFKWINSGLTLVEGDMAQWERAVQFIGSSNPDAQEEMASYLRNVDVPISKIHFEGVSRDGKSLPQKSPGSPLSKEDFTNALRNYDYKTTFVHETSIGKAEFDIAEESRGTRNLLAFFLPWSIKQNQIVLVDEFDSSLHPKLVAALVLKHINSDSASQLIFSTHDTHLMDAKILRRDQFWLTERDDAGATQLRSIHDFDGREGEDIEKRYYEGRYRSLPILAQG